MSRKPNFFILGAPKCGTTSIARWLETHPQVFFSALKEPHFFNTDDTHRFCHSETDYLEHFAPAGPQHKRIGEGSVWYLLSSEAVPNIERWCDEPPLYIVCIRNPADMAPSLHAEQIAGGSEVVHDFEEAWALSAERRAGRSVPGNATAASHLDYETACAIGSQIERLQSRVPAERILFVSLDQMKNDNPGTSARVLDFLGLEPHPAGGIPHVNAARRVRSPVVSNTLGVLASIKRGLPMLGSLGLLRRLRSANLTDGRHKPLSSEMRRTLTTFYRPEVKKIAAATGIDTSGWK